MAGELNLYLPISQLSSFWQLDFQTAHTEILVMRPCRATLNMELVYIGRNLNFLLEILLPKSRLMKLLPNENTVWMVLWGP